MYGGTDPSSERECSAIWEFSVGKRSLWQRRHLPSGGVVVPASVVWYGSGRMADNIITRMARLPRLTSWRLSNIPRDLIDLDVQHRVQICAKIC